MSGMLSERGFVLLWLLNLLVSVIYLLVGALVISHIPFPLLIGLQVGLDPLFAEYYILQLGLHPQRQTEKRVGKQKKRADPF